MLPLSLKRSRLRLPVVSAPMFLLSTPATVVAACRAGIVGTFPSLNAKTPDILDAWLSEIRAALERETSKSASQPPKMKMPPSALYGVNLIVHKTNRVLERHLALVVKHRVPLVITSLGLNPDVISAVHSYNGIVLHDVTNAVHAQKALAAGVDGIIAVCVGAGGHSGHMSPMALIPQLRRRFPTAFIIAGGAVSDGQGVRAMQTLGADLVYMGTRFIGVQESPAPKEYKQMVADAEDAALSTRPSFLPVLYTDRISGVHANFLRQSLVKAGLNPDNLAKLQPVEEDFSKLGGEQTAWTKIWSAGHGSVNIKEIDVTIAQVVDKLCTEYNSAAIHENKELAFWTERSRL